MTVLFYLILVLLFFIIVLTIPLTLNYKLSWKGSLTGELNLHWLFGLVRIRIPASRLQSRHTNKNRKLITNKHKTSDTCVNNKDSQSSSMAKLVRTARIVMHPVVKHRVSKLVSSLWRSIDKRNMKLRLRMGLGDPADTGMLWTFLGPFSAFVSNIRDVSVNLEPEFQASALDFESSGVLRIVPVQSLWLLVGFALSPVLWQALYRSRH